MEEDDDAYWLKVRCHRHHCLILLGVVYKHFMNRLHLMHTLLSIQTGICQCMHTACMHLPYQRNDHRHHKQEQTSEIIWSPCHVHEGFGNHWCLRIHSYLWLFVLQFVASIPSSFRIEILINLGLQHVYYIYCIYCYLGYKMEIKPSFFIGISDMFSVAPPSQTGQELQSNLSWRWMKARG